MDVAARLISEIQQDAVALAVAHALESLNGWFSIVSGRLDIKKLHPIIRELVQERENG